MQNGISIHVLRAEDDAHSGLRPVAPSYFNPRPPCGGRQDYPTLIKAANLFQSTSSVRRTTLRGLRVKPAVVISIHVLRAEDDEQAKLIPSNVRISIHVLRAEDDA